MKRKKTQAIAPEWSYAVEAAEICAKAERVEIEAGPEERAALARRFGVLSVDSLKAVLSMQREQGNMVIRVHGSMLADVSQACVITGDPVVSRIEDGIEGWYADPAQAVSLARVKHERIQKKGLEEVPVLDEKDDPEPIVDGLIDLGEFVAQYLSLAINPYPHKDGVDYEPVAEDISPSLAARRNPFAALKDWKAKRGESEGP